MRVRFDDADPTAVVGFLIYAGNWMAFSLPNEGAIRLVQAAIGAIINHQWGAI